MARQIEIDVPDIGDFAEVEIIEILVKRGQRVNTEDSLITLESDKSTMEIPSPAAGNVAEILVEVGDMVAQGHPILTLDVDEIEKEKKSEAQSTPAPEVQVSAAGSEVEGSDSGVEMHTSVLVLGGGPGGYTAAFRASDLGLEVVLVEQFNRLGGVCLNVGCIPSKTLLHTAQIINEASEMAGQGVDFGNPKIDFEKLRRHKDDVVAKLTGGLVGLAKKRKVKIIQGYGKFESANRLCVESKSGTTRISFDHAVIAAGSRVVKIPDFPHEDPRVWDSTDAVNLLSIPKRLLVIGGGIIGLEMATVYDALGSKVTVVELSEGIIPGCDQDLSKPLLRRIQRRYENIFFGTRVSALKALKKGIQASFEGPKAPEKDLFDAVLVAVGRRPNADLIAAENAGIKIDEQGFIQVDNQMRTSAANIYAIGDIAGNPMLAHKATHEGKVAAEVIAGKKAFFEPLTIPSVAYTDPEIAWMGLTEIEAKERGIEFERGAFPWAASGRALSIDRNEGLTKALFDKESGRILGAGIVGPNAGELIAEAVLALEMGADAEDIGLTIHPHPTLSETLCFAAEVAEGTCTDILAPKKPK